MDEIGASLTVIAKGAAVVDVWGGVTAPGGSAWTRDTLNVVYSCTKAATALCVHLLAARGAVDLDAPLTTMWPELRAAQEGGTIRMMLDHTIGLPALREPVKPDAVTDASYMIARLEREEPFWEPGSRQGYHALTFGFLLGEVVARVSGRSLGAFFRDEIATPLGLDFHIGLPEAAERRVAPVFPYRPAKGEPDSAFMAAAKTPGMATNLFVFNSGDWASRAVNTRGGREAEIGAAGGIANGRALASMFAALLDGGGRIGLNRDIVAGFSTASAVTHRDEVLRVPTRFGPGFMLSMDNRHAGRGGEGLIIGRSAFGHVGMGGSLGFADPEAGLAFGYSMNRLGAGLLLNRRGQSLVDSTYRCLGYRTTAPGFWAR
ncbi:class A beta-lactamase-related serine hydrolase [Aquibium carbonis]|uniref:Class A beta-lactamase-related serine hydrolase n=2 Tax=Aquibium carbonis TaxID=2495581 RepID=A0A3S0GAW9_9HYPH|nr:class A beta-lactamase-related serine hydrolase [Aquibium carbonis]